MTRLGIPSHGVLKDLPRTIWSVVLVSPIPFINRTLSKPWQNMNMASASASGYPQGNIGYQMPVYYNPLATYPLTYVQNPFGFQMAPSPVRCCFFLYVYS